MSKVPPKDKARNHDPLDAQEAFQRVLEALKRDGYQPSEEAKRSLQDLAEALPDETSSEEFPLPARHEGLDTDNELARSKRRGRHDKKKEPAGYKMRDGALVGGGRHLKRAPADPQTTSTVLSLLYSLACKCWIADPNAASQEQKLSSHLRSVFAQRWPTVEVAADEAPRIAAAWKVLTGREWGEPRWQEMLENQLHMNAYHREQDRLRELHGYASKADPPEEIQCGALFRSATGAEILAHLKEEEARGWGPVPVELTAQIIEGMIARVGLNPGGKAGGKKTARKVVEEFAQVLERARTMSGRS